MSKFIVIEGIEGAGKTTVAAQVATILKNWGIKDVVLTREPGGTPISEIFRALIKIGKDEGQSPINCYAELLFFYAARVQLLETVIRPALLKGTWVIGDRYDYSSQAYQGGGRGINSFFIKSLSKVVLNNFYPDIVFYLDVPPEIGLSRIKNRKSLDYIERESIDFFNRVRLYYKILASQSANFVTIDATQTLDKVNSEVQKHLEKRLNIQKK